MSAAEIRDFKQQLRDAKGESFLDSQITPLVRNFSQIQSELITWLWQGWLPRGKLTIIAGHPGDGKSTITVAIAAALSSGGMLPDASRAPLANTLFLIVEDGAGDTVRPRLDLHRADLGRVFVLDAIEDETGRERAVNITAHIDQIREVIHEHSIDLLVIDPITSFMPRADRNAEGDVRDVLHPLIKLLEETQTACLAVMHVGKSIGNGRRPLQQLLGSTAFGAIARVVWMVGELSDEEQPQASSDGLRDVRKILGVTKSNIWIKPPALEWSRPLDAPIQWHGLAQRSIDDVMSSAPEAKSDSSEAKRFLEEELKGGMKPVIDLFTAADALDISKKQLRTAKSVLGIEAFKETGVQNGRWYWKLPSKPKTPRQDAQGAREDDLNGTGKTAWLSEDAKVPNIPESMDDDTFVPYEVMF